MKTAICATALVMLPLVAMAEGGIAVDEAYARSTNPRVGAAFMVLDNRRETDCTLTGVRSEVAERVELHTHRETDGVMQMMKIKDGIEIPAGAQHVLRRGGDHVMLMGLRQPLQAGQEVSLVLDLGVCGLVEVTAPVDNDRQPDHAAMGEHAGMQTGMGD